MKILVTGGAGFIGSNFIHYQLKNYDDQIINVDKLSYAGNLDNLKDVEKDPNYEFHQLNICDREKVANLLHQGIDYIVNFAAESHVDRSIEAPSIFVKTNIEGTQNLLDLALEFGVKKFVQISTDEVYGSLGDSGKFREDSILNPSSPYSASKAAADLLVKSYAKTYKLPVNITRCSNNFGSYQYPEKLIPLFIINALHDKKLPLYGDGSNVRDWIYVKDHCRAVDLVMRQGRKGEVYNIGANNEKSNLEITKKILSLLSKSELLIKQVEDRKGHDYRYAVDNSKIKTELDWEPEYDFENALRKTLNWYLDHKKWWQKLL
ncbi:dTDP-glucose 4,6-dehydratase [Halanaerobium saccharolyticum]|uniref:dTDP-glucose 4,6-dehydratase n=1 Tax=Halanaerobium saccharolyticum TaxID=43595 RepID=A0A4V3G5V9_9FIRM|nr:dTDP-glucose 4,6-dehydratase [Halanaerobium saccharolyticum]RAK04202.1 dTDP-glucose 4,6-dehydratase [Halanaerobium saccharolyticum]TDW06775.1 dTDP-glucose 4,6-dehydratase [Halanaerobium saccharolyticum]TDX62410.1 dTDP-glucose 4,6-dehydratase [Halanaerobium saccharolyticum]